MLFPTHLVAAPLLRAASGLSLFWLAVGAALPDVVDKPLGIVGVVDLFHSVGHSLALLVVAVPVALYCRAGLAAAVGWGAHLLLDTVHVVVNGRPGDALFLAWPAVVPPDPPRIPPGEFVWHYLGTPSFFLEAVLWVVLAVLFVGRHRGYVSPRTDPGSDRSR
jgi:hypothetical protein